MSELFGVPVGSLAVVLAACSMLALGAVAVLALRNRVFFRLGVRNVTPPPGRTALIVRRPDARARRSSPPRWRPATR